VDGGGLRRKRGGGAQAAQAGARASSRALWAAEWAKEGKKMDWQSLMPPRGFPGAAEEVGGGAHLRVDQPQPKDGQRLREAMCERRGLRLRGDDAADGEEVGPCVGISRQSLHALELMEYKTTVLLSKHKHRGTQVSCDAHRKRSAASRIS
jgi:hypothetical protein